MNDREQAVAALAVLEEWRASARTRLVQRRRDVSSLGDLRRGLGRRTVQLDADASARPDTVA